ncbi:hypothetical protein B0T18DRAFT_394438 [Schizothecium vesticola]|uniref:Uncharacterized protein n=1 Tax=Schizothecium vesticola TaxID=314040 RepID=A0AA40BPS1_9PEZI|nr:hypothetical protein B0T18DRAFT_394438 [Schizothecium vesticola]
MEALRRISPSRFYTSLLIITIALLLLSGAACTEVYHALVIGDLTLQALVIGGLFSLFRAVVSELFTEDKAMLAKKAMLHIDPMRMEGLVAGDSLSEEDKNKFDAALLSLACYLLLARMATRLIGAMVQEVEYALSSMLEWFLLREEEGGSLREPLLTKQAEWTCCWCRALDSWLGSMSYKSEGGFRRQAGSLDKK